MWRCIRSPDRRLQCSGDGEDRGSGSVGHERHIEAVSIRQFDCVHQKRDCSLGVGIGPPDGDTDHAYEVTVMLVCWTRTLRSKEVAI